ncbi:hypothetical protein NK529_001059 [Citrobacter amalonaticus]|nr:hypothetical protein [Citrobacter amalonaticus]HAT3924055.1 hypothetical protein [Citrobacter amalonaticus]
MINLKNTKIFIWIPLVLALLFLIASHFYTRTQSYACTGQQKVYLSGGEYMNLRIKINIHKQTVSMTVKGAHHQADGSMSKIYRQGTYQYRQFYNGLYETTLLQEQRFSVDKSPDRLSSNIFGINVGEKINLRSNKIRDDLLVFGTEYIWVYACQMNT